MSIASAAALSCRKLLVDAAEAVRAALKSPGVCVAAILPDGEEVLAAAGVADQSADTPMGLDARMPGGSTGKSIVAATALSLSQRGLVALDAPLSQWLGSRGWFSRLANGDTLTLRLLLTHASGLPDHMGQPALAATLMSLFQREGLDAWLTPEEGLAFSLDLPAIHKPGEGFSYSDTNYVLAGLALEAATGAPLYALAQENVLTPLDLGSTTPALSRTTNRLAPGHIYDAAGAQLFTAHDGGLSHSPRTEWAGGGFYTCARDLAVFGRAYASGRLLGREPISALNRFSWSEGHIGGYGLGLFAARTRFGMSYGHGGYFPGYQSQFAYYPDFDVAVAYQANVSQAFGGYASIVESRVAAASNRIAADAELSLADDACVTLASALTNVVTRREQHVPPA